MRIESLSSQRIRGVLLATVVWTASTSQLHADLNHSWIRTVEWLVDNSQIIAVLDVPAKGEKPKVLYTLKGDAERLVFPLKHAKDSINFVEPPARSKVRLVFVRFKSQLLQDVGLARQQDSTSVYPSLYDVFYGVTQFGEVLTTESKLMEIVEARIRKGPARLLGLNPKKYVGWPQTGFALETSDETYSLIFPLSFERRDHYIKVLQTGNALDRLFAIRELAVFAESKEVVDAIRAATKCREEDFPPGYQAIYSGEADFRVVTAADVRKAAKKWLTPKGKIRF